MIFGQMPLKMPWKNQAGKQNPARAFFSNELRAKGNRQTSNQADEDYRLLLKNIESVQNAKNDQALQTALNGIVEDYKRMAGKNPNANVDPRINLYANQKDSKYGIEIQLGSGEGYHYAASIEFDWKNGKLEKGGLMFTSSYTITNKTERWTAMGGNFRHLAFLFVPVEYKCFAFNITAEDYYLKNFNPNDHRWLGES